MSHLKSDVCEVDKYVVQCFSTINLTKKAMRKQNDSIAVCVAH